MFGIGFIAFLGFVALVTIWLIFYFIDLKRY